MSRFVPSVLAAVLAAVAQAPAADAWRSSLYPENGYDPSSANLETDRVLQDFSYAGYRAGAAPIPDLTGPVFDVTAAPYLADATGATDATAAIQSAINAAGAAGGGVVFLPAGTYRLQVRASSAQALMIDRSGVVLRGAGVGKTFLLNATSVGMRYKTAVRVSGPGGAGFRANGAGSTLLSADLLRSTRTIPVTNTSAFHVGGTVVVRNDITDAWVTEHGEPGWLGHGPALGGLTYRRTIVAIDPVAKTLTVDAPTRYSLKLRDGARVHRIVAPLTGVGVEDLSIGETQHPGTSWKDEDGDIPGTSGHDVTGAFFLSVERASDCWVRRVESYCPPGNTSTAHLLSSGIALKETTHVTIEDCRLQRPQYGGSGGNGYLFCVINAAETLIRRCEARYSRHGFVITGLGSSGNVIHDCLDAETGRATGATGYMRTEGLGSDQHKHFSQANLTDLCTGDDSYFEARYRPFGGDPKHNLTAVHSVFWNTRGVGAGPAYVVRSEQARYGYVIGTRGTRVGVDLPRVAPAGTDPPDHVEGIGLGDSLVPRSLLLDQRLRRLGPRVLLPAEVELTFPANTFEIAPSGFTVAGEHVEPGQVTVSWSASDGVVLVARPGGGVRARVPGPGEWMLECVVTHGEHARRQPVKIRALSAAPTTTRAWTAAADTYVEGADAADANFGRSALIALKRTLGPRHTRRGLLRFDLAPLGHDLPVGARLLLTAYAALAPYSGRTLALRPVLAADWTETGATWNNAPSFGEALLTYAPSPYGRDALDITGVLTAAWQSGRPALDLALTVESQVDDSVFYYHSREQADTSLRPRVEVELVPAAHRFSRWIADHAEIPASARGATDDPDSDGLPNILEMALARDPAAPDAEAPLVFGGDVCAFTITDAFPASTRIALEKSADLVAWSEMEIEAANIRPLPGGGRRIEIPAGPDGPRTFWRLRLHTTP